METFENLLPFDGEVYYLPEFIKHSECLFIFQALKENIEWKHEPIWMFGKQVLQPRLTALYGDVNIPYSYSGISMAPLPLSEVLLSIKDRIAIKTGYEFTHVLLNYYRNGQDSMGWHRDNEKSLGVNPVIASVSFGVSRVFQLRNYREKNQKISLTLENGSLLIMAGKTQDYWEHQVPKSLKINEERINLTFRKLII